MEYEKFYGKLWKQGDSLIVTIPANIVRFAGFSEGDEVTIMMQKKSPESKENAV